MNDIDQLKKRIDNSSYEGVETAHIRDDYEPAGAMMISHLTNSDEYILRKVPIHSFAAKWKIYKKGLEPY